MNKTLRAALRCFAGSIGVLAAHGAAQAQDQTVPTERVEEVIVTGTRAPKAVDKIPGAINVVSAEEVSRTLSLTQDATAVLARTVPGYSESSQAVNSLGETLRGRVPLRLFDGIPQSTPLRDGSRNSVFTDMDIVGRIEVINGPSAAEGIGSLGRSTTGEKTMLDALVPAVAAAQVALEAGNDARAVLSAARVAAEAGAAATIPMLATKGRASYLGERSIGHQDPGATSAALLIGALADALSAE